MFTSAPISPQPTGTAESPEEAQRETAPLPEPRQENTATEGAPKYEKCVHRPPDWFEPGF